MMMPNGFGFVMNEPGWQNHCLEGNILTEFGLPSVRFYGTPWPQGSQAIVSRFGSVGDGILGVTLMLRGHAEELAGLVPVTAPELAPLWVAEIPGASPRVELRASAREQQGVINAAARLNQSARSQVGLVDQQCGREFDEGRALIGPRDQDPRHAQRARADQQLAAWPGAELEQYDVRLPRRAPECSPSAHRPQTLDRRR